MGGVDDISCQQPSEIDDAAAETLGVAGGQKTNNEARQRQTSHDVLGQHGHPDGLRRGETKAHCDCSITTRNGWSGRATFENVESTFSCARCIRQGSVEAPRLRLKMSMQTLENVEPEWMKKKMGVLMENREGRDHQIGSFCVGRQSPDHVPLEVAFGTNDGGSD